MRPQHFQAWRTKGGVVLLVTACIFGIAWIRSLLVHDVVNGIVLFGRMRELNSSYGALTFSTWPQGGPEWSFSWEVMRSPDEDIVDFGGWPIYSSTRDLREFVLFSRQLSGYCVGIRYWLIVLPTTVLSAFLLIIKPRKKD